MAIFVWKMLFLGSRLFERRKNGNPRRSSRGCYKKVSKIVFHKISTPKRYPKWQSKTVYKITIQGYLFSTCLVYLFSSCWKYLRFRVVWFKVDIVHCLLWLESQDQREASYVSDQILIKLSKRKSDGSLPNPIQSWYLFSELRQELLMLHFHSA